mgnify:FL=1|tara:strand:+ start:4002 stop:5810 length:1809 start_codon:yes stop_codon:yes gene_type:complete
MGKKILGISAFFHDSAAALVINKKIVAAAQEERFTRIKFDPSFPRNAVKYCLKEANLKLSDIDEIVYFENSHLKFDRIFSTYIRYLPKSFSQFINAIFSWFSEKLFLETNIKKELGWKKAIKKVTHHFSHAASAFYPSPYDHAAIIVLDSVGEWACTSIGLGEKNKIEILKEIHFPNSLGMFYSAFTQFSGFRVNADEYKLMGLAPYGNPKYKEKILKNIIKVYEDGSYKLNLKFFNFHNGNSTISRKFEKLFGYKKRNKDDEIREIDCDLAASAQSVLDEIFIKIAKTAKKITGSKNVVLAGGVALNCVSNGKLAESKIFENVWIQPAAGDAGGALGAALRLSYLDTADTSKTTSQEGSFFGPDYSNDEIESFLKKMNINYKKFEDDASLIDKITNSVTQEKIVALFNGRMEFGPRALGSRSIIGDPRSTKMQKTMNLKIKYRESFRPFAPAIMEEHINDYFKMNFGNSFMSFVFPIQNKIKIKTESESLSINEKLMQKRSTLPAITHVDYSARIQTVNSKTNSFFYRILDDFYRKTQCPVLINTSFNVRDEPIVCNYIDALKCFFSSDIDLLIMNKFLINKYNQNPTDLGKIFISETHYK